MKSQKGITMISLILYVASFVAVTAVVAGVTTFFYSNMQVMNTSVGNNSSYNKMNLYLVNECKKPGVQLYAIKGHNGSNEIKEINNVGSSAENGLDFQLQLDKSTGKDVITVLINIDGTAFKTKYVVGS